MWLLHFIPFHVEQRKRKETTDIKNVLACGFLCLVSASRHHGLQHIQLVAITTELESQTAFILWVYSLKADLFGSVWFSVGCSHSAAPSSSQHSCHVEAQCLWGPHLLVGVWNALFLLAHTQNKHTLALTDIHTQTLSIYIDMEALSDIPCLISLKYPDCCSCSWNVQNFSANCVKTRTGPEDREA